MRRIREDLGLASGLIVSNVWLLTHGGKRFLIDTGHALERPTLRFHLKRAGIRDRGDLDWVLLTHRHSDHAGNARWLRETFGAKVACHEDDAPELTGSRSPPMLSRWLTWPHEHLLCRIEDRFPARAPVDETFADGPWDHGFRVVHVPGHTAGSVMLHHEPTGALFAGDAILAGIPPLRTFEYPRFAVRGFSLDVERCRGRVRDFLGELPATRTLCSGHGPAITEGVEGKLRRLLARALR